jgi:hypothetical protein
MRLLAGLFVALFLAFAPALAQDKPLRGVALVIGQSEYTGLPVLKNPASDAAAMEDLLRRLGFEVTAALDGDQTALTATIAAFVSTAATADVALVYYSGHGIEAGGQNYLVPIDADLSTPVAAGKTLMPVEPILHELAKIVPVTILLLDACRSDAFPPGTMIQPPGTDAPVEAQQAGLAALPLSPSPAFPRKASGWSSASPRRPASPHSTAHRASPTRPTRRLCLSTSALAGTRSATS